MGVPRKSTGGHVSVGLEMAVQRFGGSVTAKLRTNDGSREDHLRAPLERLLQGFGASLGLHVNTVGETRLPALAVRPDYAIDVDDGRVGYVELKQPGRRVPPDWSPGKHDREQWEKLSLLPNVLYTDGQDWALFHDGVLDGKVAHLEPPLRHAGRRLHAADANFQRVLTDFLIWKPERPRNLRQLVRSAANLCRLLRDDVREEIHREHTGTSRVQVFTSLAEEWRGLLFPRLTDPEFGDAYAQTVTFALLLARVEGIDFTNRAVGEIAIQLGKKHSLMGKALSVLTEQSEDSQSVVLGTMLRIFGVVEWDELPADAYSMLYEQFLIEYDPELRKKSGVYYTPQPVVAFMTRFVDEIIRSRLNRRLGFAADDVIVVDPAMGTGSYLSEIIDTVAGTIRTEEGAGAVPARLRQLSKRLIGFEKQVAPYAVAELRIQGKLRTRYRTDPPVDEQRFLADTLDDPATQALPLGGTYEAIMKSRRGANRVKSEIPVMVVVGNPPYGDKVRPGTVPWLQDPSRDLTARPSLDAFRTRDRGRFEYVLSNQSVMFWRWATWKTFDAHPDQPAGIVALITTSAYTTGAGFAGMREYLRRTTDEGWILNLSPEGHRPPMDTRVFRGNGNEICIGIFVRSAAGDRRAPARIYYTSVAGIAEDKMQALNDISVESDWQICPDGWTDNFAPTTTESIWRHLPSIKELMPWSAPGIKPNRTWVYAPDPELLSERWRLLTAAPIDQKAELFKESDSRKINSRVAALPGMVPHVGTIAEATGPCPEPVRIAYRSFDRQWTIPDARVHHRPSPSLWHVHSPNQLYVIEQHTQRVAHGPGLVFSSLLPDMDCYMGHHGGRVFPLYRDQSRSTPNLAPGLAEFVGRRLHQTVTVADLLSYIAGVTSHSAYTECRTRETQSPAGSPIPVTLDRALWMQAIDIGREVLWLHTYGERYVDAHEGRPAGPPRLATNRPMVVDAIPNSQDSMPDKIWHDPDTQTLHVGLGQIRPVSDAVWEYTVGGRQVVRKWFGYRKQHPGGRRGSPLDDIYSSTWTAQMTQELLELLNVLGRCVALEPAQARLLDKILHGPIITGDELREHGIVPAPREYSRAPSPNTTVALWTDE